jgi:uncharacterized protein (DUF427 family)
MQAIWNDEVVAESDETILVEGNHYFPEDSVRHEYLRRRFAKTICPWKGVASYYDLTVKGETSPGAAWQYRHPLPLARKLKNRFAFWGGVHVVPVRDEHQQRR